jgi:hypothetical protein
MYDLHIATVPLAGSCYADWHNTLFWNTPPPLLLPKDTHTLSGSPHTMVTDTHRYLISLVRTHPFLSKGRHNCEGRIEAIKVEMRILRDNGSSISGVKLCTMDASLRRRFLEGAHPTRPLGSADVPHLKHRTGTPFRCGKVNRFNGRVLAPEVKWSRKAIPNRCGL